MPYATIPDNAECLGRELALAELKELLDRPTPAHVSLIGPETMGKTVLLRELARRARTWDRFHAVVEWDLRRLTPHDDDAFFERMGKVVFDALEAVESPQAGWISGDTDLADLKGLVKELREEGFRLLVILDHLDRPLDREEGLTKDLWDNLRFLAQSGALTLVTATPKPLQQHCPRGSRASEFWNIFQDPITVGPLSEEGLDAFLEPLESAAGPLATPARKAIAKQTGRSPLLVAELANQLLATPEDTIVKQMVESVAEALGDAENDRVKYLWEGLAPAAQGALYAIQTRLLRGEEAIAAGDYPEALLTDLKNRGYVTVDSSNQVAPGARIMLRYAGRHGASQNDLARLFSGDRSEANWIALLHLELDVIEGGDPDLRLDIKRIITALHPRPGAALKMLRDYSEVCLGHMRDYLFPDGSVPGDLLFKLYNAGKSGQNKSKAHGSKVVARIYEGVETAPLGQYPDQPFPIGEGSHNQACELLSVFSDPECVGDTGDITNGTIRLAKSIHDMGNYGVHAGDYKEEVSFYTAAPLCALGVELFRRLASELPNS